MASGWKVYKSGEPMSGNTLYVHIVDPVSAGQNYLETYKLISETFPAEVQDLYGKTKDAFVPGGLGRLNLTLVVRARRLLVFGAAPVAGRRLYTKRAAWGRPRAAFSLFPLCSRDGQNARLAPA